MNEIEAKTSQLLADMAHATAWLNFTTATANHDLERFGKWRCDYEHQAAGFQADYENAGRELVKCVGKLEKVLEVEA